MTLFGLWLIHWTKHSNSELRKYLLIYNEDIFSNIILSLGSLDNFHIEKFEISEFIKEKMRQTDFKGISVSCIIIYFKFIKIIFLKH